MKSKLLEKNKLEVERLEPDGYTHEAAKDALEAMKIITKQGHSGTSLGIMKYYLDRMIEGKPLTPLTGEDSEWEELDKDLYPDNPETTACYQNKRYSSVFKEVYRSGHVACFDIDAYEYSEDGEGSYLGNSPKYYVEFPYMPGEDMIVDFPTGFDYWEKYDYILHSQSNEYENIARNIFLNSPEDWSTYCSNH